MGAGQGTVMVVVGEGEVEKVVVKEGEGGRVEVAGNAALVAKAREKDAGEEVGEDWWVLVPGSSSASDPGWVCFLSSAEGRGGEGRGGEGRGGEGRGGEGRST